MTDKGPAPKGSDKGNGSDRSSRIILIVLAVVALATAGAAIVATLGEWNYVEPAAVEVEE